MIARKNNFLAMVNKIKLGLKPPKSPNLDRVWINRIFFSCVIKKEHLNEVVHYSKILAFTVFDISFQKIIIRSQNSNFECFELYLFLRQCHLIKRFKKKGFYI